MKRGRQLNWHYESPILKKESALNKVSKSFIKNQHNTVSYTLEPLEYKDRAHILRRSCFISRFFGYDNRNAEE